MDGRKWRYIFPTKPNRKEKPKNPPGIHESAKRGAMGAFRGKHNSKGTSFTRNGRCVRFGDASRHWRDCQMPFSEKLKPQYQATGKGRTFVAQNDEMETEGKGGGLELDPIATCAPCVTSSNPTTEKAPGPSPPQQSLDSNAATWAEYYGASTLPSTQTIFSVSDAMNGAESSAYKRDDANKWKEQLDREDPQSSLTVALRSLSLGKIG